MDILQKLKTARYKYIFECVDYDYTFCKRLFVLKSGKRLCVAENVKTQEIDFNEIVRKLGG